MDPILLQLLLQVLAPGGVAAVAVKLVLNGTKERVKEIAVDVKEAKDAAKATSESVQTLREIHHNHEARIWLLEHKEPHE